MIKIFIGIGLIVLGLIIGIYIDELNFTGKAIVENKYSWTKAICNDNNECIDIRIECENGDVKSIRPISDLKKFELNWSDPRLDDRELCN